MRERAARLAELVPPARLDPAVRAWAVAAPRRQIWGVGFSGGADSLALLLLLWAHWPERRRYLRVLHFDHRQRGAESRADARFCRQVCARLGLRLVSGAWREAPAAASEAEARAARRAFFARHARILWLGHQQDDVAETLLMRLARGSGTGGLAAPRPVQELPGRRVHLRPLLGLKGAEIRGALREARLAWREDSTNAGTAYFRNRVRAEVLPRWIDAARRDAVAGAARSRLLLEEDDRALERWLDELKPFEAGGRRLRLDGLAGRPRALWRRALHRWLVANPRTGEPSRQAVEALLEDLLAGRKTRHSLGAEGFAVTDGHALRFVRGTARRELSRGHQLTSTRGTSTVRPKSPPKCPNQKPRSPAVR